MPAHASDYFFERCDHLRLIPIFLPAHSSDQTQPLDLGIFGIQKAAMGRIHPPDWLGAQTKNLARILGAWRQVTIAPNVVSAFAQMGVTVHWDHGHKCLLAEVHRQFARKLREARSPPDLKRLKTRKKIVGTCGWIELPELPSASSSKIQ
jgi:hypothetical protein